MRSVQVSKPKGPLEIVEKDVPEPATHQVRIKVQACGECTRRTLSQRCDLGSCKERTTS